MKLSSVIVALIAFLAIPSIAFANCIVSISPHTLTQSNNSAFTVTFNFNGDYGTGNLSLFNGVNGNKYEFASPAGSGSDCTYVPSGSGTGQENFHCASGGTKTITVNLLGDSVGSDNFAAIGNVGGLCDDPTALVVSAAATPTPVPATAYTVNPTDKAEVALMSGGATGSFLSLFENNWPIIVTLIIVLIGFSWIWHYVKNTFTVEKMDNDAWLVMKHED